MSLNYTMKVTLIYYHLVSETSNLIHKEIIIDNSNEDKLVEELMEDLMHNMLNDNPLSATDDDKVCNKLTVLVAMLAQDEDGEIVYRLCGEGN